MAGGGGGGSTVANTNLHPSVVPAFQTAAAATQGVQNKIPVGFFTTWAPNLTAGIAPMQQQAMRAAIHSTQTPSGLSALFGMANPLNMITSSMMNMAQPNDALGQVYQRLGFQSPAMPSPMHSGQQIANAMPSMPSGELFPGMGAINPGQATQGVPLIQTMPIPSTLDSFNPLLHRDAAESQINAGLYQ
jgi:hypothetical protein